jgi:hypothetical protein
MLPIFSFQGGGFVVTFVAQQFKRSSHDPAFAHGVTFDRLDIAD